MVITNFRQYILAIQAQLKRDRKVTKDDTLKGKKKGLDEYQRGFYHGHLLCLKQIYDEDIKYDWVMRKRNS